MNLLLRTLLHEWRERKLPPVIGRDTRLDLLLDQEGNYATVVTGFRRVGKTYLIYQAVQELLETHPRDEVVYINFEDERIISPTTDLLTNLVPEIQALSGKKPIYLFLDELQLIPNWSKWVRRMLDTQTIKIYITGSSAKMGSAELPTELRGRAWEVKVKPLTFGEWLRFKGERIDLNNLSFATDARARFRYLLDEYLIFGALPAVVLTEAEKKLELLQSYFQTVVQRDIAERRKLDNDLALKTLLKLLLNSSYVTISKLTNSLKSLGIAVGKSTIINYLDYIEDSFFMDELPIYHQSVKNQLQYPRKVFFVDTGFITALSTKFSKNMGRLFENMVYQKLAGDADTLYYTKDRLGHEVDFVLSDEVGVKALYQVCYDLTDEETQKREVNALIKAGKTLKCQDLNFVTVEKPEGLNLPPGITAVTAAEFLA